ncbi:MAG: xanthine dehydrogenase family protein molybdopterin-binding subunit [Peptococcaceae bacterium]|nr:xanthine dehydrogenase family protein molybdopterin-binding subunit [Peptococcaceae bacterium]
MAKKWVGTSIKRKEDASMLTGEATYVDDMQLPGMLHCAILRSDYAHANIKSIDVSEARKLPGVIDIITGEDVKEYPLAAAVEFAHFDLKSPVKQAYLLAVDRALYAGQPIAAVAAVDKYIAEDALDLIQVHYEPLTPVVSMEQALSEDAPLIYEEWGDNVQMQVPSKAGDVDAAFAEADRVIKVKIGEHRYCAFPLEGRAAIADYKPRTGKLHTWISSQASSAPRANFAKTLKIPEQNVSVTVPHVGGAFGTKLNWSVETIPCLLSKRTGRPVKYVENKIETFTIGPHARDYVFNGEVACKNDGTILGVKADVMFDLGIESSYRGTAIAKCVILLKTFLGQYKIKNYSFLSRAIVTNKAFQCSYRAFGKEQGSRFIERIMNIVARELGISPEEIRLKNYIQPEEFPYRTTSGALYDSGDYPGTLKRVLEMADIPSLRKEQARLEEEGRYLMGIGIASFVQPSGSAVPDGYLNGMEGATLKLLPEGGFILSTAHCTLGQGIETTLSQVVADEFTVTPEDVRVIIGDSDKAPYSSGGFASRGAAWVVGAAVTVSRKLKEKVLRFGAHVLKVEADEVELKDGKIQVKRDPAKSVSLHELATSVHFWPGAIGVLPDEFLYTDPSLDATAYWTAPNPPVSWAAPINLYCTHPNGAEVSTILIDKETGKITVPKRFVVYDCGTLINPDIVKHQYIGGALQGINGILNEELCYDENGQLTTTTYMDYLIPGSHEMLGETVFEHQETPSPFTPLGCKGMGEAGTFCSVSSVMNAVEDALGITITKTPLKPQTVLDYVKEAMEKGTLNRRREW